MRTRQNAAVLDGLTNGVTSLWLRVDDPSELPRMLAAVLLDLAPVALDAGHQPIAAARALMSCWEGADLGAEHGLLATSETAPGMFTLSASSLLGNLSAGLRADLGNFGPLVSHCVLSGNRAGGAQSPVAPAMLAQVASMARNLLGK